MPRGAAKGERRGGRALGTPNVKTLLREAQGLREELAKKAEADLQKARGRKLGKEVLYEFMTVFAGMAASVQPAPPGQINQHADEAKFQTWATLAVDTAYKLAQFESPKYRAIAVFEQPAPPPPRPGDDAKVIDINDPVALARIYRRVITASRSGR